MIARRRRRRRAVARSGGVDEGGEVHRVELSAMPVEAASATIASMALTLYWGSGSPFSWRVLLALEHKRLPYESQLLHFDKQEHQSPQMLKMNPRGRRAGAQGRRLRGVRVGGGALLPRREVSRSRRSSARRPRKPASSCGSSASFRPMPSPRCSKIVERDLRGEVADDIRRAHRCHARGRRARRAPSKDA